LGLRDDFVYPPNDLTRTELYSFDETLEITKTIRAKQVAFVHLEEYWNRSFDDYRKLEKEYDNISFAYDGMEIIL
jgi:phosphoribosyl 1,2-cyclic phosphate phosphodiesterase